MSDYFVFAESFRPNPQVVINPFDFFNLWSSLSSVQLGANFKSKVWTKKELYNSFDHYQPYLSFERVPDLLGQLYLICMPIYGKRN